MEIGKTFCGRTDGRTYGRTDGRTHLSSNLLGHRRGDDLKIEWWGAGIVTCLEQSANDMCMLHLTPPLPPNRLLLH